MRTLFKETDHAIELFREVAACKDEHSWSEEEHIIKDNSEEIKQQWVDDRLKIVHSTFEKEYDSYVENREYFYGCPHELYLETYDQRLSSHLSKHEDYTVITFIESEFKDGVFLFNRSNVSYEKMQKIQASLRKRFEFLVEKAREEHYNVILSENDKVKIEQIVKNNLIDDDDLIEDNSGTFDIRERIIALHKLGILDYLYNHREIDSVLRIAKAIKSFTGFNYTTVQSYINPIFNLHNDQSNSALKDKDQIEKIQKHLDDHVLKAKK
ncbi:hypothetical protein OAB20_02720 [Winogradskyella sp.]|nr:hypothetical protein [Winogradskyella sp.]